MGWKGTTGLLIVLIVLCAAAWPTSSYLRERVTNLFKEVRSYQSGTVYGPAGERLEFWRKSTISIAKAPVLGHGTGSIREEFRRSAPDQADRATPVPTNPHNQIFAIAMQLGLVGAAVLIAMWVVHLRLFWGPGLAAGIGVAVVVQNIVSSLFNSALFDFSSGWAYVWGVGVLGGMLSRAAPDSTTRSENDRIIS